MKLFKKAQPEPPTGRRRPGAAIDLGKPAVQNPAFSYHSQRSNQSENTGRMDGAQSKVEAPTGHRFLYSLLAVLAVAGFLYCSLLSPRPNIILDQTTASANFLQDKTVYSRTASQVLSSSLFNRNKITVDTTSLRLQLLQSYPEIQSVSVTLPLLGHSPQVHITPYDPSFILTTKNGGAFLLDSTGRALATTNQVADISKLAVPTLEDRSALDVKIGSRVLPSSTISFVQTVLAALHAKQVDTTSLVLPAASYEFDAYVAGTNYYVKFNLQADALQQAGTYLATKQRLEKDHVKPGQYIDVRVPERAYYK